MGVKNPRPPEPARAASARRASDGARSKAARRGWRPGGRQMLTAGLGGVAATAIDVCLLVLMVESGVSVPAAAFFASCAGAAVNFVVNKYIAFRDRSPITLHQLSRFGAVAVATAMWMALAMKVVAVELGVPYVVAKLVCAVLVFVAWTYPAQRRLVFAPQTTSPTWRVDVEADADVSAA